MREIWKDINGYEGFYQISNYGRIRSFKKIDNKWFYLKPWVQNSGYEVVSLAKNTVHQKYLVHRLVAENFIPNPDNLPCVNHKDENKLNNHSDNLEWCSYEYNNNYGTARIRMAQKEGRRVKQLTIHGHWIATYMSIRVASNITNTPHTSIRDCCNGKTTQAHGFKWEYDDQDISQ